jgi:hypothetical protein
MLEKKLRQWVLADVWQDIRGKSSQKLISFRFDLLNRDETLSGEKNRFIVKNQLTAMIVAVNSDTERTFTNSAIEGTVDAINASGCP